MDRFDPLDEKWCSSIYLTEYQTLCYLCNDIIHHETEAEDIVSDCFRKLLEVVLRQQQDFPTLHHAKSYLYIMVRNASVDYLRKSKPGSLTDVDPEEVNDIDKEQLTHKLEQRDMHQKVLRRIAQLPPKSREIMELFFLEDKSLEEIAEKLGLPKETVYTAKYRALQQLRAMAKTSQQPISPDTLVVLFWMYLIAP